MNKSKPAKLPELTGVRGLAALWVWLYHAWFVAGSPPVRVESIGLKLTQIFSIGWVGVDLFFVLSGFVLVWPFIGHDARPFSFSAFMCRRALRVLPAYYAQMALLLALAAAGFMWDLPSWKNTFAHVLLLHNLNEKWSSAVNGPWWTMPIEWQFYLIFPVLIALLLRFGAWRVLPCMVAVTLAWRYGSFQWLHLYLPAAPVGIKVWLLGQLPGYICEFFSGMVAAWLVAKLWPFLDGVWWRARLSLLAFLLGGTLSIAWMYALDLNFEVYWQGNWLLFVWNIGVGFLFALLLFGLALGEKFVHGLFANRAMLWLGEISYSLYLWHFVVLEMMIHFGMFGEGSPETRLIRVSLYSIGPVLLVASLSWWLTERPFLQYRKETATNRLSGAVGWVVHRPWVTAAIAGSALVSGIAIAENHLRPANSELASCTQRGYVDMPQKLTAADDTVHISGWAYDWDPHNRIRRIVLSSGGTDFAEATLGQLRQDVVAALSGCRVGQPGFEMRLPLVRIPSRTDPVIVHAERKDGERFEIGRIPWT